MRGSINNNNKKILTHEGTEKQGTAESCLLTLVLKKEKQNPCVKFQVKVYCFAYFSCILYLQILHIA